MPIGGGGGGGGGPAAGSYLPVANKAGVTVDSTTYNDTIAGGGAKLTTLVFPGDAGALAIALSGDSFPRYVFASDPHNDGLYMGNGSYNPVSDGVELYLIGNKELGLVANGQSGTNTAVHLGSGVTVTARGDLTASQTIEADGAGGVLASAGPLRTLLNAAPSDGALFSGEADIWVDATNGASKLMIKAKSADGTVVTAAIALA